VAPARGARHRIRAALVVACVLVAVGLFYEAWTWPRVGALARARPRTTAFIERYRAEERADGRDGRVAWTWVGYGQISADLKRAVLVEEDINFFSHHGFELTEMQNALERTLEEGKPARGASTITQQLAKNLWLSPSRNPLRKIKEAVLTWQLERTLDKRRILECYLNVAEFGPGIYGVEAAARRYFGKGAAEVGRMEGAQLAASLPSPRRWHPGAPGRAYQAHVARVLRRMERAEFLARLI
jgi:monofunctional biosynthetic peptidoglycan transglycosylase